MKPFRFSLVTFFLFSFLTLNAGELADIANNDINVSDTNESTKVLLAEQITKYTTELKDIDNKISDENVWIKNYASYLTSLDVKNNLDTIKKRIKWLSKHAKGSNDIDALNELISKESILASQIEKLKGGSSTPFSKLITPPNIEKVP